MSEQPRSEPSSSSEPSSPEPTRSTPAPSATAPQGSWTTEDSVRLYGIDRWGNDYFGLDASGQVTARTLQSEVSLMDIVQGMAERDLQMPVLLRIENILDAQLYRLNETFRQAIAECDYQGVYRGVYPIKVNQQAQVVEEIGAFGARYQHGFEVGSKPEMIAALATLEDTNCLLVCNGYKDEEFFDLGLNATKLGFKCFFVIETPTELPVLIERSRALGITPSIGIRVKMTTKVSGHWNSTSGDRSVFGLNTRQIMHVVDTLKQENMLHCLQLMHCHLGSQIPNIRDIRNGIVEACRYFADLVGEGAPLTHIDLGGGLAVDYTGSSGNDEQSRNYSLEEYCLDIVETIKDTLDSYDIPHPTIVTESGRATVAYSSVLLFNVLDVNQFAPTEVLSADTEEPQQLLDLRTVLEDLKPGREQECFNDAHFYRNEVRELFKRGQITLRQRAVADNIFAAILHEIVQLIEDMPQVPSELADLKLSLSDIYYGNFSLFQSLPDIWAIDQLFPIMPIHRLDEQPSRQAILADITCDCDGKIDRFIDPTMSEKQGFRPTLDVHPLIDGEEYYLGVFLVGAYQETLGDLHNLFGDTNVVSVRINRDNSFDFVKEIHGDTIADVLSYVEYDTKELQRRYRNTAENAVREGRISARERQQIMQTFNASLHGYTYFER